MQSAGDSTSMSAAGSRRATSPRGLGAGGDERPETPEAAAQRFEEVLVRQFVQVMTKDMFSSSLSGQDGGAGWMKSQRDRQRRMMTEMISEHLAEGEGLQIEQTLLRSWGQGSSGTSSDEVGPLPNAGSTEGTAVPAPRTPKHSPSTTPSNSQSDAQIDHAA